LKIISRIKYVFDPGGGRSAEQTETAKAFDLAHRLRYGSGQAPPNNQSPALQKAEPSQDLALGLFSDRAGIHYHSIRLI
jgi:hypothetical protein